MFTITFSSLLEVKAQGVNIKNFEGVYTYLPEESESCDREIDSSFNVNAVYKNRNATLWYTTFNGSGYGIELTGILTEPTVYFSGTCWSDGFRYRKEFKSTANYAEAITSSVSRGFLCNGKRETTPRRSERVDLKGDLLTYTFNVAKRKRSNKFKTKKKCVFLKVRD